MSKWVLAAAVFQLLPGQHLKPHISCPAELLHQNAPCKPNLRHSSLTLNTVIIVASFSACMFLF